MAEEISASLSADGGDLYAELEKAAAQVERLEGSMEKLGSGAGGEGFKFGNQDVVQRIGLMKELVELGGRYSAVSGKRGKVDLGIPDLTPELVKHENQLKAIQIRRDRAANNSMKFLGTGALQAAYAFDDLQYGVKGVLNNIPGLVMGLGGSMGLAGALSVVALAASVAYPYLKKLYGDELGDAMKTGADASKKLADAEGERLRKLRVETGIQKEVESYRRKLVDLAREEGGYLSMNLQLLEQQKQVVLGDRRNRDQIFKARVALADNFVEGEDVDSVRRREEQKVAVAKEERRQGLADLREDLAREQALLEQYSAAAHQKNTAADDLDEKRKAAAEARRLKTEELDHSIAEQEQALVLYKAMADKMVGYEYKRNVDVATKKKQQLEDERSKLEALGKVEKEQGDQLISQLRSEADTFQKKYEASFSARQELEKELATRERVSDLEIRSLEMQKEKAIQAAKDRQAEEDQRKRQQEWDEVQEFQKMQERKHKAEMDFSGEIMAMQLQVRGRQDLADALKKEVDLRERAKRYAEETGVSEMAALQLMRQKQVLEMQVDARQQQLHRIKKRGLHGLEDSALLREMRRSKRDHIGASPGDVQRGIWEAERGKRHEVRAGAQARENAAWAAKYYEQMVGRLGEMVEIFKGIGVV